MSTTTEAEAAEETDGPSLGHAPDWLSVVGIRVLWSGYTFILKSAVDAIAMSCFKRQISPNFEFGILDMYL